MSNLVSSVASRIKLATLQTGRPRFTRLNKRETKELANKHNTDAGRVTVAACDDERLLAIDKLYAEARDVHMTLTRPSIDGLARLLPNGLEFRHAAAMRDIHSKVDALSNAFLGVYDDLAAQAPIKLNGLYDSSVWKPKNVIAGKFQFRLRYLPCPTDGEWAEWLEGSVGAAQSELVDQLREAITRVAERCASQGPLYQTVFSNLDDLLKLVPDLDLKGDPRIKELLAKAAPLAQVDRANLTINKRQALANQANQLLGMFGEGGLR